MQLDFSIHCDDLPKFIEHWSGRYRYAEEDKYENNIGKALTDSSRLELFEWKNGTGSRISATKLASIRANYPLLPPANLEARYLDHTQPGGPIWNIFYLHCVDHKSWPIFDQHTYRAMRYIKCGAIEDIGVSYKKVYEQYSEYRNFLMGIDESDSRKLDKALFCFGQFLKLARPYT